MKQGASPAGHDAIIASLKEHLLAVRAAKGQATTELDVDANLYEVGLLDSLNVSEFLSRAEKQYGVSLPDWLLGGHAQSIAAIAAYIETQLAGKA